VSAKGAFAWRALFPTDYTARTLAAVLPARSAAGWASGVYESGGRSTGAVNVNTQAVILEAALFRKRGGPLLGTP
jgi:type II secretory pathway component PulK